MNKRKHYIDTAKAIGIVAVIAGHAPGVHPALVRFIYSFHMPLFFFLSGYLVRRDKLTLSVGNHLRLQCRNLALPYLIFFGISFCYWIAAGTVMSAPAVAWQATNPLMDLLMANKTSLAVNIVLWFFPCLIVCTVFYHLLRKSLSTITTTSVAVLVGIIGLLLEDHLPFRLPWAVDTAVFGLLFYALGVQMREDGDAGLAYTSAVFEPGLIPLYLALTWVACHLNGRVDLNSLSFGRYKVLYIPTALTGIAATLALARKIKASRFALWLSQNTLIIFPLHTLFFGLLTGMGMVIFRLPLGFKEQSGWISLGYIVAAIAMSYPASLVLQTVLPGIFGQKKPPTSARI